MWNRLYIQNKQSLERVFNSLAIEHKFYRLWRQWRDGATNLYSNKLPIHTQEASLSNETICFVETRYDKPWSFSMAAFTRFTVSSETIGRRLSPFDGETRSAGRDFWGLFKGDVRDVSPIVTLRFRVGVSLMVSSSVIRSSVIFRRNSSIFFFCSSVVAFNCSWRLSWDSRISFSDWLKNVWFGCESQQLEDLEGFVSWRTGVSDCVLAARDKVAEEILGLLWV